MSEESACEHATDAARTGGEQLTSLLGGLESCSRRSSRAGRSGTDTAVVLSCSMSPYSSSGSLWPLDSAASVTGIETLGNQTWEHRDRGRTLEGGLAQFVAKHDLSAVVVVGHTGCEVVRDAHERCLGSATSSHAGIEARLEPVVALARRAVDTGLIDTTTAPRTARYRLVEYNVVRQVEYLTKRLPDRLTVAGHVRDQDGAYSSFPGREYLVAVDGIVGSAAESRLPENASVSVASLLESSPARP